MVLTLLLVLAAEPTVFEANAAGMKLYQARKYLEAKDQFVAALKDQAPRPTVKEQTALVRTRALAEFNLACTLSLLRRTGKVCAADAYRGEVMAHVLASIALDPNRLEKALTDKDLAEIRDTVAYQSLLGLSLERDADVPKVLPKVSWWSQGQGVYGSLHRLQLGPDGRFTLTSRVIDDDGAPKPSKVVKGTWSLTGRTLKLVAGEPLPGLQATTVELTVSGTQLESRQWTTFTDAPSECDA